MTNKIKLIQKLITQGIINFEEGLSLMQSEKEYIYVPQQIMQNPYPIIVNPSPSPYWYGSTTCDNENVNLTNKN